MKINPAAFWILSFLLLINLGCTKSYSSCGAMSGDYVVSNSDFRNLENIRPKNLSLINKKIKSCYMNYPLYPESTDIDLKYVKDKQKEYILIYDIRGATDIEIMITVNEHEDIVQAAYWPYSTP